MRASTGFWLWWFLVAVIVFVIYEEWKEKASRSKISLGFYLGNYSPSVIYNYLLRMTSVLPHQPFHKPARIFPALEANYRSIRKELFQYLEKQQALPAATAVPLFFRRIGDKNLWKVVTLKWYSKEFPTIQAHFPQTMKWLQQSGPKIRLAMFSIMDAGNHVPVHCGPFSGCLRYHLPLEVPPDPENCFIVVNGQKHSWKEGEPVLFDDTYSHEVWNNSKSRRIVLFLDVERDLPTESILAGPNRFICHSRIVEWLSGLNNKREKIKSSK